MTPVRIHANPLAQEEEAQRLEGLWICPTGPLLALFACNSLHSAVFSASTTASVAAFDLSVSYYFTFIRQILQALQITASEVPSASAAKGRWERLGQRPVRVRYKDTG
jgi:hypothetical protein